MASEALNAKEFGSLRREVEWQRRFGVWLKDYRLLILALVGTFTFHAGLLFNGTLWGTYDAFVHMFFADHYARSWFDLWEERWYTGFTMVSYPPLTHQLTALLSKLMGIPNAYIILILFSTIFTTLGIYRFSRLWVSHEVASYAALLAVFSSSIAETVHVFGQSPTMFVIGILLNALPFVWHYVEDGEVKNLLRSWAMMMIACAGHHVTTIFGMIFFCGPILATILWRKFRKPLLHEGENSNEKFGIRQLPQILSRRLKRVFPALIRCGIFGAGFLVLAVFTVLPYWLWSRSDPITQVTIPHGSRESFIVNTNIGFMFFLVPWGVMLLILPYALYKGFNSKNWILAASLAGLAFLGTGGTTPIPALLLRGAFYILTLDRFTFWATIMILPFAGQFVESLLKGRLGKWIVAHFGGSWRAALIILLSSSLLIFAVFVANLTTFRKFQPANLDMLPIVEFLAKDNHDNWRYMTLGFGDQMAWLSAQTTALNVEGNYHSARRLPEMTSTPIERMDGAKYQALAGLGTLHQILSYPQRYNLKYIFVNDAFYEPLLYFYGWNRIGALDNDVAVWEAADVPPLPNAIPQVIYPDWQRLMWGTVPISSVPITIIAFMFTAFVPLHPEKWWGFRWFAKRQWVQHWLMNQPYDETYQVNNSWQFWRKYTDRVHIRLELSTRRRLYSAILLVIVLGIIAFAILRTRQEYLSPERILLNYYDALDFKRFSESYDWLATDLSLEEYMRYLSLRGGILASYAKLNNLIINEIVPIDENHLKVRLHLDWLTALRTYSQAIEHDLVNTVDGWRIVLDVPAPPIPNETFLISESPEFYIDLPLTSLTDGALNRGVLDRSLMAVGNIQVVYIPAIPIGFVPEAFEISRFEGRWDGLISVLGVVQNRDVYPSQVTVTAIFYDVDGNRLGESNAAADTVHQLLPQEITAFRIDFFGAAATSLLNVEDLVSVEVIVQGTPTRYNLTRPLVLLDENTLYNNSPNLIDIPRVLVTDFDENEDVLWTQSLFLEQAIAPNAELDFVIPPMPENLEVLEHVVVTVSGPRLEMDTVRAPRLFVSGFSR
jgi:hypothetical protein